MTFTPQPHDIDHVIPKKMKKELLQPKKDKRSEIVHLPILPLSLHRQFSRKSLTLKEKMENLEICLAKIISNDGVCKELKKPRESPENIKPNHEAAKSVKPESSQPVEKVKEKRKPGRPRHKEN